MVENTNNTRSWWVVPLIAFIAGLLIGWWAIGWGVWPVEWRNALPTDLRPDERNAYLQMTAESFAQNKDLRTAQERLASWPADELAKNLATLQTSLAGANLQSAAQVQSLIAALNLQPAAPTAKPTAKPTAAAPAVVPTDLLTQLRRICTVGLWVLLFLGGVAVAVVLYRRWQAAQAAQGGPAIDESLLRERPVERSAQPLAEEARRASPVSRREEPQPLPAIEWPQAEEIEPEPPFLPPEEVVRPTQARPPAYRPAAAGVTPPAARPAEPPRRPPTAAATAGQFIKVGEFRAGYQMDESDYDEAFDINDIGGAHIGQCGLALNDPIGKARDQAAAFQAWLWDANDPDTQVKVLMSEGAYRDVGLRDQLAGAEQHPIIQARPGADFELQTHKLLLRGTVERMDYAAAEPLNGVFAELAVRMIVYRKA